MRKRIWQILRSDKLSLAQKLGGLDFFFVLSLQALYMIIAHLSLIPAYNFWCSFSSSVYFNAFFVLFVVLLVVTHIPFFVQNHNDCSAGQVAKGGGSGLRQALFSFYLMTAMFCTFSFGLMEGLLGRKVHRDRTGKGDMSGAAGDFSLPASSIDRLRNINRFEMAMAGYSLFFVAWAVSCRHEYVIGAIYTILAIIYPINAIVSNRALRNMHNHHT